MHLINNGHIYHDGVCIQNKRDSMFRLASACISNRNGSQTLKVVQNIIKKCSAQHISNIRVQLNCNELKDHG